MIKITPQVKTFFLGLSISILILVSFFGGAIADRVFVVKPLDFVAGKLKLPQYQRLLSTGTSQTQLGTLAAGQASVADVAEAASDSVVTVAIKTKQPIVQQFDPFGFGFGMFGVPSGQTKEIKRDIGSGFVADETGLIVTNKHVVSDPNVEYLIIDKDDQEYSVSQIYRDPTNDLAILKADNFFSASFTPG